MTCKPSLKPRDEKGQIIRVSLEDGINNAMLVVLGHPEGITAHEVAKLISLRTGSTLHKLRELRAMGYIGPSRYSGGQGTTWMPAEESKIACEAYALIVKKKRAAHKKAKKVEYSEAEQEAFEAGTHRVIPAHMGMHLRNLGPRWVFDLGRRV
jgi:hypothetical protein